MIGILDLGLGNLRSLSNAVAYNGFDFEIVGDPARFDQLTHLIIPGVGNFAAAMKSFEAGGWRTPVHAFARSGRPVLGVCLGMQLLATKGTESGLTDGIGFIPGVVKRLEPGDAFRIPHVGWNVLNPTQQHPIFQGLKTGRDFYFVHSYAVNCDARADVLGETEYGGPVTAVIGRDNVVGFQFHPEKSEKNGLMLLENFCLWDGKC
ncbi:MAG: imidazole glycerol phosphate synthase subunit HisH [Rhodospirillaceae bacterium]